MRYEPISFQLVLRVLKLHHVRTRPYTPRTNGKAERFIQSTLREWTYARAYDSSSQRAKYLPVWLPPIQWAPAPRQREIITHAIHQPPTEQRGGLTQLDANLGLTANEDTSGSQGLRRTEGTLAQARRRDRGEPRQGIAPLTLNVTEDNTATYSVRLATEPTSEVTITPTSGDHRAASVAPTLIRFTPANWTTPQTFTVTGERDADTDDETVTITHAVTGADYGENAVSAPHVTVGITDHVSDYSGGPGVRIIPTTIEVDEGGTAEYAVVLAARPTGTVIITVHKDSLNYKTDANPGSVRFTAENWDTPQTITVSAREDDDTEDERTEFSHSSRSGDYEGVSIPIVVARVRDDDGEGAKPAVSGHLGTAGREGEAVGLSLRRTESTAAELEVAVSVSETGEFIDAGDEGERTITFAPGARIATLSIETADNAFGEPDATVTARIVDDSDYRVGNPGRIDATVMDDEGLSNEVGLAVDTQSVAESGAPTTVNVTAWLDRGPRREPTAIEVTVGAAQDSATSGVDYRTVEDLSMTIRSGATSATASFTLEPTEDTQGEGDERISLTGSAGELTLKGTQVTIIDDDPPSEATLEVSPASIGESAGATSVEVTARLNGTARPDATIVTVVVGQATDDATQGMDYQMVGDLTLTIPAQTMRATSRFTLTPTNDSLREGPETISVTGSATGLTVTGTHIAITDDEEAAGGAPTITAANAFRVPATRGRADPNQHGEGAGPSDSPRRANHRGRRPVQPQRERERP